MEDAFNFDPKTVGMRKKSSQQERFEEMLRTLDELQGYCNQTKGYKSPNKGELFRIIFEEEKDTQVEPIFTEWLRNVAEVK